MLDGMTDCDKALLVHVAVQRIELQKSGRTAILLYPTEEILLPRPQPHALP